MLVTPLVTIGTVHVHPTFWRIKSDFHDEMEIFLFSLANGHLNSRPLPRNVAPGYTSQQGMSYMKGKTYAV